MADYLEHSERHRNHRQPRDRRVDHDPATGVNAGPPSDRDGAGDAPDEAKGLSTPAPVAVSAERGNWMQTFTGRQFYPLDPRPEEVEAVDIAHALSLICRYGGHVDRFYSVAEHCVLMSRAVSPAAALHALLHDATEAYVGDMVRPLKHHMPQYRTAEAGVWGAVIRRFSLYPTSPTTAEVKEADSRILLDERAALMSRTRHEWDVDGLTPLGVAIEGWAPEVAERAYLTRLAELTANHPLTPADPHDHDWDYSNTPGVDICTTCGDLRNWPKGMD